jgi:hypothetical protein
MARNVGGPKTPETPHKVVGGKLVGSAKPAEKDKLQGPARTTETAPVPVSDEFDKVTGQTQLPELPDDSSRGANLRARLTALGKVPIKTAESDRLRVRDGSGGKIVEGSVTIESPKGLQKLEGVVRVSGDLTLQETRLSGPSARWWRSAVG